MMKQACIALAAGLLLSACTTTRSLDCENQAGGWCGDTRQAAQRSWLYAQMSTNSYDEEEEAFTLPGSILVRDIEEDDPNSRGYAYAIFDRFEGQELAEVIVAFRGTEFDSFDDWLYGNILGKQDKRGLATVKAIAEQLDTEQYRDVEITVTGHSLGGGIAHYVSLHPIDAQDGSVDRSFGFNHAPRLGRGERAVERFSVAERGELLSAFRYAILQPLQVSHSINCQPGFSPGRDHGIRALAECLTWIAAFGEEQAGFSLLENPNISRPAGQFAEGVPAILQGGNVSQGRVPVNPQVTQTSRDGALAYALMQRLEQAQHLTPLYDAYAGYSLTLSGEEGTDELNVIWRRNGLEISTASIDCTDKSPAQCVEEIVTAGDELIGANLKLVAEHN